MAVKTKRVTIDGQEYEITQLGALEGSMLWKLLLDALAGAMESLSIADGLDERAIAGSIGGFIRGMDVKTVELFRAAFAKRSRYREGDRWPELTDQLFDQHFAGEYVRMTKWLGECAMFNFASFLGEQSLTSLIDMVKRKGLSKPGSPTVSTGASGGS